MTPPPPPTILAVDDDDTKRYLITRTLRGAGFQLIEAETGAAALEVAAARQPDLVVLDVNLPDIDGFEVCRRLKAAPATAHIPVLNISARFILSEDRTRALDIGADGYLPLEAEPAELLAAVRALLRIKRAEETAHRLAAEWQTTFDAIADGVALADADAKVVRSNEALGVLAGRPAAEIVGMTLTELFGKLIGLTEPPPAPDLRDATTRTVLERQAGPRWLRVTLDPIRDAAGRFAGGACIVSDITDRKTAEAALREEDRRKDEFLAMLAHELRNPLAPIRNAVQVFRLLSPASEPAKALTAMVDRQLHHMTRLVDDLLDVSRITRGKITLRQEVIALKEVIDRAVETSRPMVQDRRHALAVTLPSEPLRLRGDPVRLSQIVFNLLANAAKYTEEGGDIRLTAARDGDTVVIRVADTGVGIAPDMLPKVFDLFSQADRTLDRAQGGLGIGLTLVKRLAEMHGGTVWATSAGLGRGSEFAVRLPLSPAPAAAPAAPVDVPKAGVARRVLVVDDNVDSADSLALYLTLIGHDVRTAYDGSKALPAAEAFVPHTVLLDIGLPGMDGYAVARQLRASPALAHTQIVAVTGYGDPDHRTRTEAAGFDRHLLKPVDPAAVAALLADGRG